MLLEAILQINILPEKKELSFHKPILPEYLESIHIRNLQIEDVNVDLKISRHGNDDMVGVNWRNAPTGWKLLIAK